MPEQPLIIGVRHHSPACARLVKERIEQTRPRYVLIEGPVDFNQRLDELFLPHQLPIAIYSYCQSQEGGAAGRGAWTPFAEFSPEWQALLSARATGAHIRFIDLPVWAQREDDSDASDARRVDDQQRLFVASGMENTDALWDHLFEDETQRAGLEQALKTSLSSCAAIAAAGKTAGSGKPGWPAGWHGPCSKMTARSWWSAAAGTPRRWQPCGGIAGRQRRNLNPRRHRRPTPSPAVTSPPTAKSGWTFWRAIFPGCRRRSGKIGAGSWACVRPGNGC